jgi:hypothetical protein
MTEKQLGGLPAALVHHSIENVIGVLVQVGQGVSILESPQLARHQREYLDVRIVEAGRQQARVVAHLHHAQLEAGVLNRVVTHRHRGLRPEDLPSLAVLPRLGLLRLLRVSQLGKRNPRRGRSVRVDFLLLERHGLLLLLFLWLVALLLWFVLRLQEVAHVRFSREAIEDLATVGHSIGFSN